LIRWLLERLLGGTAAQGDPQAARDAAAGGARAPAPPLPAPLPEGSVDLAQRSNAFGLAAWPHLAQGDIVFSPASLSVALAMVHAGARGDTAAELARVMRFLDDGEANADAWGALARALARSDRGFALRIANRLYGEATYPFEESYLVLTARAFEASLARVDFAGAAEAARSEINGWVFAQTERRIRDLLPPMSVDADTKLALVNAVYFLADWAAPFDRAATSQKPFERAPGDRVNVPTMHQRGVFSIAHLDDAHVLAMPYVSETTDMLVVVPSVRHGLSSLEGTLSAERLAAWRLALAPEDAVVALPKFEIAGEPMSLARTLAAMGVETLFDPHRADLSGIAKPRVEGGHEERLCASVVFHKAFVKVDEKGTEAAAATAVLMGPTSAAPRPAAPFVVDQPFLFFVCDRASGLVLFAGRVTEPSSAR
jgi:serpin B